MLKKYAVCCAVVNHGCGNFVAAFCRNNVCSLVFFAADFAVNAFANGRVSVLAVNVLVQTALINVKKFVLWITFHSFAEFRTQCLVSFRIINRFFYALFLVASTRVTPLDA